MPSPLLSGADTMRSRINSVLTSGSPQNWGGQSTKESYKRLLKLAINNMKIMYKWDKDMYQKDFI